MATKYWLVKSEPTAFSIDDFEKVKTTHWDGVRNFQARNYLRDEMKTGDKILFYHSSADPKACMGYCEVAREGYPDFTAFDSKHIHYDSESNKNNPTWYMVDLKFLKKFKHAVTLAEIKKDTNLHNMKLVARGNRLSVMPITKAEFETICKKGNVAYEI